MKELYKNNKGTKVVIGSWNDFESIYPREGFYFVNVAEEICTQYYLDNPSSDGKKIIATKDRLLICWKDFGSKDSFYLNGKLSVEKILKIFDNLKRMFSLGTSIFINCVYGVSRSSTFTFLFLCYLNVIKEKDFNKAFDEAKDK